MRRRRPRGVRWRRAAPRPGLLCPTPGVRLGRGRAPDGLPRASPRERAGPGRGSRSPAGGAGLARGSPAFAAAEAGFLHVSPAPRPWAAAARVGGGTGRRRAAAARGRAQWGRVCSSAGPTLTTRLAAGGVGGTVQGSVGLQGTAWDVKGRRGIAKYRAGQ